MPRLRTYMYPVMSRFPAEDEPAGARVDPVNVTRLDPVRVNGKPLYWLDEMLGGGLEIPRDLWNTNQGSPSFVILLAGPPGTGKTTFALELCYNIARHEQVGFLNPAHTVPWTSLFASLETPGDRILDNALSFGWDASKFNRIMARQPQPALAFQPPPALEWFRCNVLGSENFLRDTNGAVIPSQNRTAQFHALTQGYMQANPRNSLGQLPGLFNALPNPCPPDVVVVDSLNMLWPQQPAQPAPANPQAHPQHLPQPHERPLLETYYKIVDDIGGGVYAMRPKILIVIVDSFTESGTHNPWEYLADAVFRFDWTVGPENYHSRSFQINKIKTQTHALGNNHVFKMVALTNPPPTPTTLDGITPRTRGIPYLPSGGTYVFPSIHWHLSGAIRSDPIPDFNRTENYPSGIPGLDAILQGTDTAIPAGFPSTHTTALTGRRGGMKSHLAYHFMLSHALGSRTVTRPGDSLPKNVLLVSLRDDRESARNTLAQLIHQQQLAGPMADAKGVLKGLLDSDRLEILYNWPGCVTPNEFFHRIFVALARRRNMRTLGDMFGQCPTIPPGVDDNICSALPERDTAEIVVLNGLDHLEAKFPLCISERVFVPALVSLFRCFKVCSVIISGDDRQNTLYDIRPLADLILDFAEYTPENRPKGGDAGGGVRLQADVVQTSRVTTVRVPAGQLGGQSGILARTTKGYMDFYSERGAATGGSSDSVATPDARLADD